MNSTKGKKQNHCKLRKNNLGFYFGLYGQERPVRGTTF